MGISIIRDSLMLSASHTRITDEPWVGRGGLENAIWQWFNPDVMSLEITLKEPQSEIRRRKRLAQILRQRDQLDFADLENLFRTAIDEFSDELPDTMPFLERFLLAFATDMDQSFDTIVQLWDSVMTHPNSAARNRFGATMDFAYHCRDIGEARRGIQALEELRNSLSPTDENELGEDVQQIQVFIDDISA